jgi:drug/metabolite transporter (DMT)-like permease
MKLALQQYTFLQLLFWSSLTSLVCLTTVVILQGKWSQVRSISRRELLRSAAFGFINPLLYYLVLFKAYALLPAQEAQSLNYTWPIMITLLSVPMLGQRLSAKSLIAILVSFLGVLVIATRGQLGELQFSNAAGAMLALCSALIWAFFWLQNVKDKRDEVVKLFWNFLTGFCYIALTNLLLGDIRWFSWSAGLPALYVGLFEMGITFLIWSLALQRTTHTAKVSKLVYLVPFISLMVIAAILKEPILTSTLWGLAFILGGLAIDTIKFRVIWQRLKPAYKPRR